MGGGGIAIAITKVSQCDHRKSQDIESWLLFFISFSFPTIDETGK
jgi:hypothetical protein